MGGGGREWPDGELGWRAHLTLEDDESEAVRLFCRPLAIGIGVAGAAVTPVAIFLPIWDAGSVNSSQIRSSLACKR